MLENIKITANNINNTNNNINRPKPTTAEQENLVPFDILDPERVNKPLKQEGSELNNQTNVSKNPNSVIEKLLKSLDTAPVLGENIRKLLFSKQFIISNIMTDQLLKSCFEQFAQNIEMNETEMLELLKFQHNNHTKFTGEFFNFLRNAIKLNNNEDFRKVLANFLKSYDCYMSLDKTTKAISNILNSINMNMPDILKETFSSLCAKLLLDNPTNSADINLNLLKNEIIPYLSKYISKTNDFGIIRNYISVLIHNVVRLETGLKDNFSFNVENLFNSLKSSFNLKDNELAELKYALIDNYRSFSANENKSLDNFFKLIETGTKDYSNHTNKLTFDNISESLLINNDVHIPLIHIFLPVNYNGVFMFSELWINKDIKNTYIDEKNKQNHKGNDNDNETIKIFLTFEMDNIGYFETLFISQANHLSMELFVPSLLKNDWKKIKNDIQNILTNNGIEVENLYISESTHKRKFTEVFGTKFIKERGLNVIA